MSSLHCLDSWHNGYIIQFCTVPVFALSISPTSETGRVDGGPVACRLAGRAALPGLGGPAARLARLNRDGDELALGGELSWVEWHGPGSEELMLEGRLVLGTEWGEIWGMTVVNVRTKGRDRTDATNITCNSIIVQCVPTR
ncbi:unnamed protein product [Fusarium graminearum]|uniref:Chromosome 4, complete genome n=1 Tax=Gibberella zeae (strain ATCC MYA-4620 / CBS 123657 / FGSC 9075 / NRRL 31084 / PH-1) TaxID=229533 RepID=A0A098DNX7_GIBZE|nr:unnamed protein product [Fusarium graminearum]CZS72425.1 unnamed protein product [Fusarium graminearum]